MGRGRSWTAAAGATGVTALATLFCPSASLSRQWSHDPVTLARDYLMISDNRGQDTVMVMWLASPMMSQREQVAPIFDEFVIIGAVHAKASPNGIYTMIDEPTPSASSANGSSLSLLSNDNLPPTMLGIVTGLEAGMSRALGQFGKGIKWYVFDPGDVRPCATGALTVKFAGETYLYSTPVPGCPAKPD